MLQPQKSPPSCVLEEGGTVNLALDQLDQLDHLDQRHDMEVEELASRVPKEVRAETVQCIHPNSDPSERQCVRIRQNVNPNVNPNVTGCIRMA